MWQSIFLFDNQGTMRLTLINLCNATHFCFYCRKIVSIPWRGQGKNQPNSGCYLTTDAKRHLRQCKLGGKEAVSNLLDKEALAAKKQKAKLVSTVEIICCLWDVSSCFVFCFAIIIYYFN